VTDAELVRQFENCTLPFAQWTHRAHVRVVYTYLAQYSFDEAMDRARVGIKRYNAHNNRPDGPTEGYNETTTHALLHLIAAVMRAYAETHPVKNADEFYDMHPQLASKHVLRFFYSPKRRMHPLAKTQFVEPDLAPLPKILDV
jgi:outer membrane protein assembly factor BamD (BamD/ComL family)